MPADWLYSKPWHRIPPWLVGLATGYVWHHHESRLRRFLSHSAALSLATSAGAVALMAAVALLPAYDFSGKGDAWAPGGAANAAYLTFARAAWAVGAAVFSVCCFCAPAAPAAAFLSARAWSPLARLTYGAYLVHPIVVKVLAGAATSNYRWSYVDLFSRFALNVTLAYALAALAFLLVEKPFMNLEAAMFKRGKPKARGDAARRAEDESPTSVVSTPGRSTRNTCIQAD